MSIIVYNVHKNQINLFLNEFIMAQVEIIFLFCKLLLLFFDNIYYYLKIMLLQFLFLFILN